MFTYAIVGRPNVGKSTLFNKLSTKKKTIVHDLPGVTRDYTLSPASLASLEFNLIDSAGLFDKTDNLLDQKIYNQTFAALEQADALFFVVDGQHGVSQHDFTLAKKIRKLGKPIILIINKCDNKRYKQNIHDFDSLGFEDKVYISSEHKSGFIDLYETISNLQSNLSPSSASDYDSKNQVIKLAVIGKPNTGKSTFINKLLNEERLITGPESGVTRDSISIKHNYKNYNFEIVDTAGLRKKGRIVKDSIEQYSNSQTIASVNTANVVIVMNDVNEPLLKQDLKIANLAIKEGKPIILVFNKIDIFKDLESFREKINKYAHEVIHNLKDIPISYISATGKSSLKKILEKAIDVYDLWNISIHKKELNSWLEYVTEQHAPPLSSSGRRIRLKYIVQSGFRPPTFKIFANISEDIPKSYVKYLTNCLQRDFKLEQVPVRLLIQKNHNPYN